MKTMKVIKFNSIQSNVQLWQSLPDRQQELLSGGAPKVNGSSTSRL